MQVEHAHRTNALSFSHTPHSCIRHVALLVHASPTSPRFEPLASLPLPPACRRAGDEGAFVLRTFSSAPLEMEQLPSPLSLVLGGHWVGHLAGGCRQEPTFGSNPQYMISCQHRTPVVLSVSRLDVRYSILKPTYKKEHCVGLLVLEPEQGGAEGGPRRCTAVRNEGSIRAEAGFSSMEEAVALITLEPELPYVVVPCLVSGSRAAGEWGRKGKEERRRHAEGCGALLY